MSELEAESDRVEVVPLGPTSPPTWRPTTCCSWPATSSRSSTSWASFREWSHHPDADAVVADLEQTGSLTPGLSWYRANVPPEAWVAPPMELPPVQAPTMGVWSSGDFALTEEQMMLSAKHCATSFRYERLDGPGHWMQLEAPDQVNERTQRRGASRSKGGDADDVDHGDDRHPDTHTRAHRRTLDAPSAVTLVSSATRADARSVSRPQGATMAASTSGTDAEAKPIAASPMPYGITSWLP